MQPSLEQLIGETVTHVWLGDYSSLYIELGALTQRKRRNGTLDNPIGLFTIYAGFNWRLEKPQSVLGSSASTRKQITLMANSLLGKKIVSASLFGHIPELQLNFNDKLWLTTFTLSKGQPEWSVSFSEPSRVHLCVERGRLTVDKRNS